MGVYPLSPALLTPLRAERRRFDAVRDHNNYNSVCFVLSVKFREKEAGGV